MLHAVLVWQLLHLTTIAAPIDDSFLSRWMGELAPLLPANTSVLDLRYPSTHDSLTYDLSTHIADGAWDDHPIISEGLHWLTKLGVVRSVVGEWARGQAQVHALNVTQQLDAGIRALDLRLMYMDGDWYSLHFMQSNLPFISYLNSIRAWLDAHPTELLVLSMTRHSSECSPDAEQWPGVTQAQRQAFWKRMMAADALGGVLVNASKVSLRTTPLQALIATNQRVVLMLANAHNFTGGDPTPFEICSHEHGNGDGSTFPYSSKVQIDAGVYQASAGVNAHYAHYETFDCDSINALYPNYNDYGVVAKAAFMPLHSQRLAPTKMCAASLQVPNMSEWCPKTILELAQQSNFYRQIALEEAWQRGWDLPHLLQVDAVDANGAIRTGARPLTMIDSDTSEFGPHDTAAYGYVDTVLGVNARNACKKPGHGVGCEAFAKIIEERRARNSLLRWDDFERGRHANWPTLKIEQNSSYGFSVSI